MKKIILAAIAFLFSLHAFSQLMHVKKYNFYSFGQDKKMDVPLLNKHSSDEAKKHPEYGILPFNAQCNDCVELIDQRTATSRQFIKADNDRHTMSQQGYFPLHYKKSADDIWRTIDPRLRPDANHPGVYIAANQPVPVKCDLNRKTTALNENGFELECNKDLTMYFYDEDKASTKPAKGDYSHYTIGEEGLQVKNMWPGIDMQQIFSVGQVETNYIINAPLQLPINKGFLVIEDHFTLPEDMTVVEALPENKQASTGYYRGDYLIKDKDGKTLFTYRKPTYRDIAAYAMTGTYKLIKKGNDYTMQVLVPVKLLTDKESIYPIIIDPIIFGRTLEGNYAPGVSADLGYTTAPAFCDYRMYVNVPGQSQLTDVYVDLEYELTHDDACADATHDCTYSEVNMELVSDTCNVTTGRLGCDTVFYPLDSAQYNRTYCTTDSAKGPMAGSIHINQFWPDFISCIPPQCQPYSLPFTLKNQDAACGDVCGYLCARGNMWQTTVYACQVEGFITQSDSALCAAQSDTFTAHPDCGVPPYHYAWSTDGGITYDTIYNTPVFIFRPLQSTVVRCLIFDSCDRYDSTNKLTLTVLPTPTANAGPAQYLCEGGTVTIGGNPTNSPAGTTIQWAGQNDTVQAYLSGTTTANPTVTVPQGIVDGFYYIVTVSNGSCFRVDTTRVYSEPNPHPLIDTSGSTIVCANQSVTLGVNGSYSKYAWSNGGTGDSITVNQPAQYTVTVTDQHGCTGSSNSINILTISVPPIRVFPDTTIQFGDSVMMYTNLNLDSNNIDSFFWFPFVNITCLNCPNPLVAPHTTQVYGLIAYTSTGCVIGDSALIQVILPINLYIPNAFNPNNKSGYNTTFQIYTQSGVKVLQFEVFDRWGEKVFQGVDAESAWDGTYKGKPAPPGVYVYIAELGLYGTQGTILKKGSVTLIR